MVFKAWLINKLNTEAGGKLIHQGETLMAFYELMPLMTAQIFKKMCYYYYYSFIFIFFYLTIQVC